MTGGSKWSTTVNYRDSTSRKRGTASTPRDERRKRCSICHRIKGEHLYNKRGEKLRAECKSCQNKYRLKNESKNPDYNREKNYKKNFGITLAQYNEMLDKQNGLCAICLLPETAMQRGRVKPMALAVDHSHATGINRGLLCHKCNRALGLFYDKPETLRRAADYLEGAL